MVKANDAHADELAGLIASQERDNRSRHVRRRGPLTGVALDGLPSTQRLKLRGLPEPKALILREGRACFWGPPWPVCPECGGHAGGDICLLCDGGAEGRNLRGRINPDAAGGPTSYAGTGKYKGGKGR